MHPDVLDVLGQPEAQAVAPAIWPLEVANVIARGETNGLVTEARSSEFIHLLESLAVEVDAETAQRALDSTLQLARRFGLSAYDGAYLELALREGLPLATLDSELLDAAAATGVDRV
ncbi:MAG: type II toxin-antitoxin system VapC family toxin [Fodinibius sp.]|nr:type II toxin-antitoxin system VapC family toxin [Fodinibius sp.]MDZ7659439.1 type II toxin-antitoxin system VapC family toxin [Fodinibius sp.]